MNEHSARYNEYLRERRYYNDYGYDYNKYCETAFGYEVSYFPLNMIEVYIIDAIQEAYRNASKRSKRIFPGAQTIGQDIGASLLKIMNAFIREGQEAL